MDILGYKSGGRDGSLCYVQDGRLVFSIEGEKDSRQAGALLGEQQVGEIVERWRCQPHVLCGDAPSFGAAGIDNPLATDAGDILRGEVAAGDASAEYVAIPHVLAHIASGFALSGLPEGQPFYALVWEGLVGNLYHVDGRFRVTRLGDGENVLDNVGARLCLPHRAIGRDGSDASSDTITALAAFATDDLARSRRIRELANYLLEARLSDEGGRAELDGDSSRLYQSFAHLRDAPPTDPEFAAICQAVQAGIFERFHRVAEGHVIHRLPLLITGGCGLNAEWNTRWRESPLFEEVFVPPVANDSGIAIGAAAMVQHRHTQRMKLDWDVYAGEEFQHEPVDFEAQGFTSMPLNYPALCEWLVRHELIVAWVQGRYEIGPRPLCHRALLAAPFVRRARENLNRVLAREEYLPVAGVCLQHEMNLHFDWHGPNPHLAYLQRVRSRELNAIRHVDGRASVLTMTRAQDRRTTELLEAFQAKTGFGVLCQAPLGFAGRGFINRSSDLLRFARQNGVQAFVIDGRMYLSREAEARIARESAWD